MANPIINLFCGIWSCLKGSLRIVLFIACLLFAALSLESVISVFRDDSPGNWIRQNLLEEKRDWTTYTGPFAMLFLSLLGTYGSFYNHRPSIKFFAIAVALGSLVCAISLTYSMGMGNNELAKAHHNMVGILKNYAKDYDWSHQKYPDNATLAWDMLQHLHCCGLDSAKDWDAYRPFSVSKNNYPKSCCYFPDDGFCHKKDVFDDGCITRLQAVEFIILVVSVLMIAFMFLLSTIAYVLLLPERSDSRSTGSQRSVLPQDYQRFEGSAVYIRQPPVAPQQPNLKHSAPPMYPDTHDIEKSAPPSYY